MTNLCVLIGRITKEVEIKVTNSGTKVCRFTLAVNRMKKDDPADFISCVAFNKTAEYMDSYIKKGYLLAVEGRIQTGSYDQNGTKIYTTDVIVNSLQNLTSKPKEEQQENNEELSSIEINDDELPF